MPPYVIRPLALIGVDGGGLCRSACRPMPSTAMLAAVVADLASRRSSSSCCSTAGSSGRSSAGPKAYAVARVARDLAADLHGRGLLPAAHLCRRAGAAAVPRARTRSRSITRRPRRWRWSPSSISRSRPRRAQVLRVSRRRRPRAARRLPRRLDHAGRSGPRSPRPCVILALGKPFLLAVRPEIRRRLSADVHPRGRPARARRGRPGRAAAQHARRAARLRAGLCGGVRRQSRPVRGADPAVRRRGRGDRDVVRDDPPSRRSCSSSPSTGSACTCSIWPAEAGSPARR